LAPTSTEQDELDTTPLGTSTDGIELHVVLNGHVTVVPLQKGSTVTVGRASSADVRIEHGSVSRAHAELRVGATVSVVDLGSQNGTRVRGALLAANKPADVASGEAFHVGLATLTVHVGRVAPAADAALLRRELQVHERESIRAALERSGGNQTKAARLLGISRRTLVSRLSEYGLPRPRKS
jgi:DNA-binding NtrC family response regulator